MARVPESAARAAARKYGVNPDIFVRQLRQESGLQTGRTSGAGAKGVAQFIDSTAKAYGVNASDSNYHDDLDGAARYMRDNLKRYGTYERALSAYNSGRPDAYKDPSFARGETHNYVKTIMGGAKGQTRPAKRSLNGKPLGPQTRGRGALPATPDITVPTGGDGTMERLKTIQDFLGGKTDAIGFAEGLNEAEALEQGSITLAGAPGLDAAPGRPQRSGPAQEQGGKRGKLVVRPGADRPGVKTSADIKRFGEKVAGRVGGALTLGTGTNHSQMTSSGNVSDHWTGHGGDFPAAGDRLTKMGRAALIEAGMSPEKARKVQGGLFNVNHGGKRYQIIFNTDEGGGHWDHLHVGIR